MLPQVNRLRLAADVQRVRRYGKSWRHPLFILLLAPNDLAESRFAFVASRRVGNAVTRNRAKRLLREAIRLNLANVTSGWDCLLIVRLPMTTADLADTQEAVRQALQRAGIWMEGERQSKQIERQSKQIERQSKQIERQSKQIERQSDKLSGNRPDKESAT